MVACYRRPAIPRRSRGGAREPALAADGDGGRLVPDHDDHVAVTARHRCRNAVAVAM
jgi:hypothetical protein